MCVSVLQVSEFSLPGRNPEVERALRVRSWQIQRIFVLELRMKWIFSSRVDPITECADLENILSRLYLGSESIRATGNDIENACNDSPNSDVRCLRQRSALTSEASQRRDLVGSNGGSAGELPRRLYSGSWVQVAGRTTRGCCKQQVRKFWHALPCMY